MSDTSKTAKIIKKVISLTYRLTVNDILATGY